MANSTNGRLKAKRDHKEHIGHSKIPGHDFVCWGNAEDTIFFSLFLCWIDHSLSGHWIGLFFVSFM